MNATSRFVAVLTSGAWFFIAQSLSAALPSAGVSMSAAVVQQIRPGSQDQDVALLVKRARAAMKVGRLQDAEVLVRRAEALPAPFNLNPLADSPKKVRRDLDNLRRGPRTPTPPSQKLTPSIIKPFWATKKNDAAKSDPFTGAGADVDKLLSDNKGKAVVFLRKGRESLARKDVTSAAYYYQKAVEQGGQFAPGEDSPQSLAADIRRLGGQVDSPPRAAIRRLPPTQGPPTSPLPLSIGSTRGPETITTPGAIRPLPSVNTSAAARPPATPPAPASSNQRIESGRLLIAARQALASGDSRRASQLVSQARSLGVQYDALADNPQRVETLVRKYDQVVGRRGSTQRSETSDRLYAELLMEQGEWLLRWKDYGTAQRLAGEADKLGIRYGVFELSPQKLLQRIATARSHESSSDSRVRLAVGTESRGHFAQQAIYDPARDTTHNALAAATKPTSPGTIPRRTGQQGVDTGVRFVGEVSASAGARNAVYDSSRDAGPVAVAAIGPQAIAAGAANSSLPNRVTVDPAVAPVNSSAIDFVRRGDQSLRRGNQEQALDLYRKAAVQGAELDPVTRQHVQNRLGLLAISKQESGRLIERAAQGEQRLRSAVAAEVAKQSRQADKLRDSDPLGAINALHRTRAMINESKLTGGDKRIHLRRIDRMLAELDKYVDEHKTEIELNDRNRRILDEIDQRRKRSVQVQERIALLVDEYNHLRSEKRFHEAEVKAKQARELAPEEPVVHQMWEEIRFLRRVVNNRELWQDKEENFWATLDDVERASNPIVSDSNPIRFGDHLEWEALKERRRKYAGDFDRKRHPKEIEIEKKLKTPVSLKFRGAPLSQVVDYLKRVTAVNIYLDPEGLAEENVDPSRPVTIDLTQQISLKSALNLILQPMHLSYVIKDEVLKITSEQLRDGNVYTKTYNVADLVIPIPNFVPHNRLGLVAALADGYDMTQGRISGMLPPVYAKTNRTGVGIDGVDTPESVLAQVTPRNDPGNFASNGVGGAQAADFDALIELITKTIEPDSWDEVGGPGSIAEFETNLSLVISQTQEVHEKIADLLEQLRRLQDLQVTIEVRFITLSDTFFERIGIDFDFDIDNRDALPPPDGGGPSATLGTIGGLAGNQFPTIFSPDGDIQVRNGSFATAIPPAFSGFNPAASVGTTLGIAILSDIEAFFVIEAAQSDSRSNIMQAPKVTLFNGQAASISDQVQMPFVLSVTPVVADFAAAQAPVIVILAEGTTLTVQAVVSSDRRFVRLTLIPFFSQIQDVSTFTFTGTTTSTNDSSATSANAGDSTSSSTANTNFTEGTTIQLPTFQFTTVTTTVSVPDGGTVLLGGVKRLSEGRNERGTPFLGKLPYVSRLFKNVGVGRMTQSLMLMVTPRIIIQEEEEEKLGL